MSAVRIYSGPTAPFGVKHGDVWSPGDGRWFTAKTVTNQCTVKHECNCVPLPISHIEWVEKTQEEINAHIYGQ